MTLLLDPKRISSGLTARGWMDRPEPVGWAASKLGEEMWSKQREVAASVAANRYTAVHSAHGTGKSYLASRLVAWWLDVHPVGEAFAVTTAPTQPQVEAILWREIRRAHRLGDLPGRTTLDCRWYLGADELVAYGRKPADYTDPEQAKAAFTGIHARYVLVVIDEAAGIPKWLWDAVDALATNDAARVIAIGNPDDPASEFERVCRVGSGWETFAISAFDTPAFTGEAVRPELLDLLVGERWVEERAKRWGTESNLYISKVLGQFPEASDDSLISMKVYKDACERELGGIVPGRYGVDVSRSGSDESAIYRNRGGRIREEWTRRGTDLQSTTRLTGEVRRRIEPTHGRTPAVMDVIGIGAGPFDQLREAGLNVVAFNASERAYEPKRFKNRRAEQYWILREQMLDGAIDLDPEDEDLGAQLTSIKYGIDSGGRIYIESKDDMKKRGLPSPDRADAAVMSTVAEPDWSGTADSLKGRAGITNDLLDRPM